MGSNVHIRLWSHALISAGRRGIMRNTLGVAIYVSLLSAGMTLSIDP